MERSDILPSPPQSLYLISDSTEPHLVPVLGQLLLRLVIHLRLLLGFG